MCRITSRKAARIPEKNPTASIGVLGRSAHESARPFAEDMPHDKQIGDPRRWLTTRELAARIGVTPETVRGWVRQGRVPVYRVGQKTLRFDLDEVVTAIRDARFDTGDQP